MGGIIIALSVTNTLLTALNHPLLKEAFLTFAYGDRLKKLKGTVMTVERLLLDAANKGELSHTILDYVEKLKDVVYDADDLFDELVTKAQRKQLFGGGDNIFEKDKEKGGKEEVVMGKMKPNPNLKSFKLKHYSGEKIARWGRARDNWGTFLPNLVVIEVQFNYQLQELPVLSKLRHLKSLHLTRLENLEYMEEEVTDSIGLEFSGPRSLDATFFPSLKSLELYSIENLKGWWRSRDSNKSHSEPAFPNLSSLIIVNCPHLVSFPPCLSLPKLELRGNSTRLRIRTANGEHASSS